MTPKTWTTTTFLDVWTGDIVDFGHGEVQTMGRVTSVSEKDGMIVLSIQGSREAVGAPNDPIDVFR